MRSSLVTLLVAVAVLAGAPAAGTQGGGRRILIAPQPGVRFTDVWSVTSLAVPGCPVATAPVLVAPSMWNLRPGVRGAACIPAATPTGSTTGSVTWTSGPRGLTMSAAFQTTERVHPLTPVAAYPELIYGWAPFFGFSSRQDARLKFPLPVASLVVRRRPDPVISTDYRVCADCLDHGPIDFSYDLFITSDRQPRWCGHGAAPPPGCIPSPPDAIEIMIWLAHAASFHPAGRPAAGGAFAPRGSIDGHARRLPFRTYLCSSCSHAIVSFVLGPGPRGVVRGAVSLHLDDFVARALRVSGASAAGYLDGIELGSEIAPAADGAPTRFWFTLRKYFFGLSG
jgi:hypothetical protein